MDGKTSKNILIVYAHQEPKSFNGALKDASVETLRSQGHTVVVSDLYEMGFNPAALKSYFTDREDPGYFRFQHELRHAVKTGSAPDEIQAEIDKVLAADLVILQTPIYWLGVPAILKGWLDKCFAEYVFFDPENAKWFDEGPLRHKKVVLSITTGGTAEFFSNRGIFGDMNVILWPIQNALRFTGFNVMPPQFSHAPADVSESSRTNMLQQWKDRLLHIWTEEPIQFIDSKHFDPNNGFQLTDAYVEKAKAGQEITTVGQNLGLPLPDMNKNKTN